MLWDGLRYGAPVVPAHILEVVAPVRARLSATRRRSTSAPASRPGSRSPASRRWRRRPCAARRSTASRSPSPGSPTCRRSIPASRGKVEFDDADEGREFEVLEHLLRRAIAETYRARLAGLDLRPLQAKFDDGPDGRRPATRFGARTCSHSSARCPVLVGSARTARTRRHRRGPGRGRLAAAVIEFAMEGLHLNKRLAKDDGGRRYGVTVVRRLIGVTAAIPLRRLARRARPARAALRHPARRWTRSATTSSPARPRATR